MIFTDPRNAETLISIKILICLLLISNGYCSSIENSPGRRKPDWLLVGASKSGTSAFITVASHHPDVGVMRLKAPLFEPHFFNGNSSFASTWGRGPAWYETRLAALNRSLVGEKTPDYMCDPVVPERIHKLYPNAQIIMFLRNPVSQAYSHFNMNRAHGWASDFSLLYPNHTKAFDPCKYLNRGLYMTHIERFLKYFPRKQLHVFIYERLKWRRDNLGINREYEPVFESMGVLRERAKMLVAVIPGNVGFNNPYVVKFMAKELREWRCKVYLDVYLAENKRLFKWLGYQAKSWIMRECH